MRAVAVDWSGARADGVQRRTIWVAEADGGKLGSLSAGRTREETAEHLIAVVHRNEPTIVGLDFSFGFPRWWADAHGAADGPAMWAVAAREGEEWLACCAPPFWGRPGRPRPPDGPPSLRRTEHLEPEGWGRPKSIFQIGGAGSVGTGSIRGMPVLSRLRESHFAIWPFDPWPASGPVVVEAYPRWCTGPVVKSRAERRAGHLSRAWPSLAGRHREAAIASEDAFDAACTALTLSLCAQPDQAPDVLDAIEGRVFTPPVWARAEAGSSRP